MFLNSFVIASGIVGVIIEDDGYNAVIVIYDYHGNIVDLSYVDLDSKQQISLKKDL